MQLSLCLLDTDGGKVIEESRVRTTPEALRRRFSSEQPPMHVAIEAGTHSPWASRVLEECGHEALVANPRRTRLIYTNKRKTDEVDAGSLARLARLDPKLLYPLKHRGEHSQAHLALIRTPETLVSARTQLVNHVPKERSSPSGPACPSALPGASTRRGRPTTSPRRSGWLSDPSWSRSARSPSASANKIASWRGSLKSTIQKRSSSGRCMGATHGELGLGPGPFGDRNLRSHDESDQEPNGTRFCPEWSPIEALMRYRVANLTTEKIRK
jgi:Transposase